MEPLSTLRRDELRIRHAEVKKPSTTTAYIVPFMSNLQNGWMTLRNREQVSGCRGLEGEVTAQAQRLSFEGDENVPKLVLVIVVQFCEHSKHHRVVHFDDRIVQNLNYISIKLLPKELTVDSETILTY